MNSVLSNSEDIKSEIKEMVKNIEKIKVKADIFANLVKEKVSLTAFASMV